MWLLKVRRSDAALEAFKFAYDIDPLNLRSLELLLDFPSLSMPAHDHALNTLLGIVSTSDDPELDDLSVQFFALQGFVPGLRHLRNRGNSAARAVAASTLHSLNEVDHVDAWSGLSYPQRLRAETLLALSQARCSDAARLLAHRDRSDIPPALALRLCLRAARGAQHSAQRADLALVYLRVWPRDTWVQSHVDRAFRSGEYDFLHSDELTAYQHFSATAQLPTLALTTLRTFYRTLQSCGYLEQAHRTLTLIADRSGLASDAALLRRRGRELMVYQGQWQPPEPHQPLTRGSAVPGRVLHVVGKSLPKTQTGYTLRTRYIAASQRDMGLDPYVFCQPGEGSDVTDGSWLTSDDIPHYFYPAAAEADTASRMDAQVHALREIAQELRPAVLHAHSDFLNGWVAHVVGTELDIPVVYESRGFWEESWMSRALARLQVPSADYFTQRLGMPSAYALRAEREHWVRQRANAVVTLAQVMREHIVDAGLDASRVHLVPNAVDPDQFPVARADADLQEQLGIEPDAVVIGYISSLVEYEGIDTLIRAAAQVRGARPVHVLIVGDGPERNRLEALAEKLSGPTVHFTGMVPHSDITRYYGLIDIFVVPRRDSTVCHLVTPLKPFEALSAGCCVVLSDVGALQEIANDSSGVIPTFRSDDVEDLFGLLQSLTHDDVSRRRTGSAGAQWVREHRSWSAVTARYLQVYSDVRVTVPTPIADQRVRR